MDQKTWSGESMVGSLIAYSVAFMVLNVAIVALRYYVRLVVIRKFGNDDVALGATLVCFLLTWNLLRVQVPNSELQPGLNGCRGHWDYIW
jgi:hypothetical protein